MSKNPYVSDLSTLPDVIPIFPLTGVLLLPHGNLPLNIFEPRYVAMVEDVVQTHRIIGMIQPKESDTKGKGEIYKIGCAGKITEFLENPDGTFFITLAGICRFETEQELDVTTLYRQVKPDWSTFEKDLDIKKNLGIDRNKLYTLLRAYFTYEGMSCDFEKFEEIEDAKLMTCLSMICSLEPMEKQALLEEVCCIKRAEIFMAMIEMAIKSGKSLDKGDTQCH